MNFSLQFKKKLKTVRFFFRGVTAYQSYLCIFVHSITANTSTSMSHRQHWHSSTNPRTYVSFVQTIPDRLIAYSSVRENVICNLVEQSLTDFVLPRSSRKELAREKLCDQE